VNPGWHPEYGFQLTFAAIAIHRGDAGTASVGANSHFTVNDQYRFDRLITVGGGIRIADEKGKVLCEYIPRSGDEKNPIGDIKGKSIEFSLPLKYLGKQDDHGGAGIGEFRAIERDGSEWIGGGKIHPSDSNVFDVLILE
jgi:hypothetical protein